MIFTGLLALFVFTFLSGLIWLNIKDDRGIEEVLTELIAKSLLISWFVVFVSYYIKVGNILWVLLGGIVIVCLLRKWNSRIQINIRSVVLTIAVLVVGTIYLLEPYDLVFIDYDPVVSWNRWGMSLSKNSYSAVGNLYPIVFPGLWSLIYKAQGDLTFWIFTKATLWIHVILIAHMTTITSH